MHALGKTCLLILLLASCSFVDSSDSEYQPADIGDSQYALPNKVKLPTELAEGSHVIRCEVKLTRRGIVEASYCYPLSRSTSHELVLAVNTAARGARFTPAYEHGRAVRVFMQAVVVVEVTGNRTEISAYPNDGTNVSKYGWNHISPQRLNKFRWSRPSGNRDIRKSRIWMDLQIDEHGRIVQSDIRDAGHSSAAVRNSLLRDIRGMDFRPGFHRGRPVAMKYVELARYR